MSLLDTHIGFVEGLRSAGVPVSLAEGLDAISALEKVRWHDRETVRAAYAATLVKRQPQRVTFDAVFDIYFPRLIGGGVAGDGLEPHAGPQDTGQALERFREALADALASGDQQTLQDLAVEAVARFGAMPGRGPGLSSWSAYTSLQRVSPTELLDRLVQGLLGQGLDEEQAQRTAGRRIGEFTRLVEGDARRRIAEEKGAEHVADVTVRPTIDRLDFTSARRSDLEEMRREIYPLARRLAARLTKEQHARRRGPLDVRRTVRASIATGGVPLTTHHRPKRPHRTDLVVLCDVSGSVANFAQFTLMLVFALREAFSGVRAFTFVDDVVEVSDSFRPGADVVEVMESLAGQISQAALWGRTNYGRALTGSPSSTPTRSDRGRRCWCWATDGPTTATWRCRCSVSSPDGPGTPGGSTPSTPATGGRATARPTATERSCRWSSAATSPSSASSSTGSSERRSGQPARKPSSCIRLISALSSGCSALSAARAPAT